MGGFPASALASRTEATFCFGMRMQMQAVIGLALRDQGRFNGLKI